MKNDRGQGREDRVGGVLDDQSWRKREWPEEGGIGLVGGGKSEVKWGPGGGGRCNLQVINFMLTKFTIFPEANKILKINKLSLYS